MTLWRLEWLRLMRTKRWLALFGVYVFFGFLGPLTARYINEILGRFGGNLEGAVIQFPDPQPVDGLTQYAGNASQLGVLMAVIVAATAVTIDSIPEMGVFIRTRVARMAVVLRPRVAVSAAAIVAAFVAGALVAWYETVVLIGPLPATDVVTGIAYGSLYLMFVVALVAAIAGKTRTVLATVVAAVVALLVFPLAGVVEEIGRWLPSYLVGALAGIPSGVPPSDYLGAAAVTLGTGSVLLWLAARWAAAREV